MDPAAAARTQATRARKAIEADDTELAAAEAHTGLIHALLAISGSIRAHADATNHLADAIEENRTTR